MNILTANLLFTILVFWAAARIYSMTTRILVDLQMKSLDKSMTFHMETQ